MWKLSCFWLLCVLPYLGQSQFLGNDLASQIFQGVQNSLMGTHNLVNQTFQNVNQMLGSAFQGMGMGTGVFDPFGFRSNLGSQIAANVHNQLAPLQNLGSQIHSQIQQSLAPVYAMNIKANMARGVGGTTVAIYSGFRPRLFLIKNGMRYICNGAVNGPQCLGAMIPFQISRREDFCYAPSYASAGNQMCLSSGPLSVQILNNQLSCDANGAPLLKITEPEYFQICGNRLPWQVTYRYYPDPSDPQAIAVPNANPYIRCTNNQPGVCEFQGTKNSGDGSGFVVNQSGGGNNFFVSSGGLDGGMSGMSMNF